MVENSGGVPAAEAPWMMVAVQPTGKRVVVAGSGAVARRRAQQFSAKGARVEIFDPGMDDDLQQHLVAPCILHKRPVVKEDLDGTWLLVVATNDQAVNEELGAWASEHGILCNRTDDAENGTLAVPALLEDEAGWQMAVLGGDAGPLFSAWMKGLAGHLISREQVPAVYRALADARAASLGLNLAQKERAFLLRRVMARILEQVALAEQGTPGTTPALDGRQILEDLARER